MIGTSSVDTGFAESNGVEEEEISRPAVHSPVDDPLEDGAPMDDDIELPPHDDSDDDEDHRDLVL